MGDNTGHFFLGPFVGLVAMGKTEAILRNYFITIVAAGCVLFPLKADALDEAGKARLRECSIPTQQFLESFKQPQPQAQANPGEFVQRGGCWPEYIFLKRPRENKVVAIVQFQPSSPAVLNPKGFDYGLVPTLTGITTAEADALWGKPIFVRREERLYELTTGASFLAEYRLRIVFKRNGIRRYAITGPMTEEYRGHRSRKGENDWIEVE